MFRRVSESPTITLTSADGQSAPQSSPSREEMIIDYDGGDEFNMPRTFLPYQDSHGQPYDRRDPSPARHTDDEIGGFHDALEDDDENSLEEDDGDMEEEDIDSDQSSVRPIQSFQPHRDAHSPDNASFEDVSTHTAHEMDSRSSAGGSVHNLETETRKTRAKRSSSFLSKIKSLGIRRSAEALAGSPDSATSSLRHSHLRSESKSGPDLTGPSNHDGEDTTDDASSLFSSHSNYSTVSASVANLQGGQFVKVKTKNKAFRFLSRLKMVQEIVGGAAADTELKGFEPRATGEADNISLANGESSAGHQNTDSSAGPIYALRFNDSGRLLACGGRDGLVRIWAMISETSTGPVDDSSRAGLGQGVGGLTRRLDSDVKSTHAGSGAGTSPSKEGKVERPKSSRLHRGVNEGISYLRGMQGTGVAFAPSAKQGAAAGSIYETDVPSDVSSLTGNSNPVFKPKPYRILRGHSGAILDLAWSRNNFLLSAAADRTVRLWHESRKECLCVFEHTDSVLAVKFHPIDDRFFASGDSRLRIWSISEKKVRYWADIPRYAFTNPIATNVKDSQNTTSSTSPQSAATIDLTVTGVTGGNAISSSHVTAVCFSRDGSFVVAGTIDGDLYFYEFDGLRYNTKVEIRTSQRSLRGPRILGIEGVPRGFHREDRILVTTADSRLRLYNIRDKSLIRRYRGPELKGGLSIKATFSQDGRYIITGSDGSKVFLFDTEPSLYNGAGKTTTDKSAEPVQRGHAKSNSIGSTFSDGGSGPTSGYQRKRPFDRSQMGSSAFSGVLSGLMHWQSDPSRVSQSEFFTASAFPVTCAVIAPVVKNDASKSAEDDRSIVETKDGRRGFIIVSADLQGMIRVFENDYVHGEEEHIGVDFAGGEEVIIDPNTTNGEYNNFSGAGSVPSSNNSSPVRDSTVDGDMPPDKTSMSGSIKEEPMSGDEGEDSPQKLKFKEPNDISFGARKSTRMAVIPTPITPTIVESPANPDHLTETPLTKEPTAVTTKDANTTGRRRSLSFGYAATMNASKPGAPVNKPSSGAESGSEGGPPGPTLTRAATISSKPGIGLPKNLTKLIGTLPSSTQPADSTSQTGTGAGTRMGALLQRKGRSTTISTAGSTFLQTGDASAVENARANFALSAFRRAASPARSMHNLASGPPNQNKLSKQVPLQQPAPLATTDSMSTDQLSGGTRQGGDVNENVQDKNDDGGDGEKCKECRGTSFSLGKDRRLKCLGCGHIFDI
ncbi:hypothetical protein HDU76_001339 [Blyttiomyces sp. JEL0837]|nr:hypothetical protein HDU76_001339 [Blyttiomyces sp. JEL0837]